MLTQRIEEGLAGERGWETRQLWALITVEQMMYALVHPEASLEERWGGDTHFIDVQRQLAVTETISEVGYGPDLLLLIKRTVDVVDGGGEWARSAYRLDVQVTDDHSAAVAYVAFPVFGGAGEGLQSLTTTYYGYVCRSGQWRLRFVTGRGNYSREW